MSEIKRRGKSNKITDSTNKLSPKNDDPANAAANGERLNSYKGLPLRILSRIVVSISLLVVVYYYCDRGKIITFAKQSEMLPGKGEVMECSDEYLKNINKFEGCLPQKCKRFVTDKVISAREVDELLVIALKGLIHGRSNGGASILDLYSGALSKGNSFVNMYKVDIMKNLFTAEDFNVFRVVKEKIKHTIAHYFSVSPDKIFLTHPTFFSEMTPKKAMSIHDEYWHPHVDQETYESFHYTTLLYLSDYDIDFKGGRFIFVDDKHNKTVEPRKGRLSIFTSGGENMHYVEKVTSGVRYAITISFTCDREYAIEDPSTKKYNV